MQALQGLKETLCECKDMDCFVAASAEAPKEGFPEDSDEARAIDEEINDCLSRIRDNQPMVEFEQLTKKMCACQDKPCRDRVAKDVVREAVVKQRYTGLRYTESFQRLEKELTACFGGPLFE